MVPGVVLSAVLKREAVKSLVEKTRELDEFPVGGSHSAVGCELIAGESTLSIKEGVFKQHTQHEAVTQGLRRGW